MSEDSKAGRASTVAPEEIEITRGEKLLAGVLAVFIAVGAIWAYDRLDHVDRPGYPEAPVVAQEDRAAVAQNREARAAQRQAAQRKARAVRALEMHREAYRTALDAGEPAAELEQRYASAQAELAAARVAFLSARRAEQRTAPPAEAAQRRILAAQSAASQSYDDAQRNHDRLVFVLRFAFLVLLLAGSYALLGRLRSRHSRYQPAAFALIGATALLALAMAAQYTGGYIEFSAIGPLAISLAGIALTMAAFIALQRYLRKRVPVRRVRRRECPFCGYPVRDGHHCEGCGRPVLANCSSCQRPRRVGTPRCATCGNA